MVENPATFRLVAEEKELDGVLVEEVFVYQLAANLLLGDKESPRLVWKPPLEHKAPARPRTSLYKKHANTEKIPKMNEKLASIN